MSKNQSAFTLIELLVTVCVVGVLLSIAVPSFRDQIVNNRSVTLAEDFTARINQARFEAVKRAGRVTICASSNSTTPTPTCTGNWTDGYIVFVDGETQDTSSSVTVGAIIRAYAKHESGSVIDIKNAGTPVTFIRFTSVGTLARIANSTTPITLRVGKAGCKGENQTDIILGVSGMLSGKRVACSP